MVKLSIENTDRLLRVIRAWDAEVEDLLNGTPPLETLARRRRDDVTAMEFAFRLARCLDAADYMHSVADRMGRRINGLD